MSSLGDTLEGFDELLILLGGADADTDGGARAPASDEWTDDDAAHLKTAAEGGGILAGVDVDEVAPAFNRRIAELAKMAGKDGKLDGVVANGALVMFMVIERGQSSGGGATPKRSAA